MKGIHENIEYLIVALRKATINLPDLMSHTIKKEYNGDPFLILISCLLSLRSRDSVTIEVCRQLFSLAKTPHDILALPLEKIEQVIYKTGFYKKKAKLLHDVSRIILERYHGRVPASKQELLSINGVGIKTANLVLGEAFGIPAICVDTHVHRISNRLGIVRTKTPEETEQALQQVLPERYWIEWNTLLVKWGQSICVPLSPKCSQCILLPVCPQIGVKKHR